MNKKMTQMGLTLTLVAALGATSVVAFADTATTTATNVVKRFGGESLIDKLIKDGVITQAQIDKYHDQMQAERLTEVKTALAKLVADGKITQVKVDAYLKAETEMHAQMEALRTKLDTMTLAERDAYLKANDPRANDPIQKLVTAGTLTQADLDAIHSVVGRGGHGGMGGPRMGGKGGMGGQGGQGMGHKGMGGMRNGNVAPSTATGKGL